MDYSELINIAAEAMQNAYVPYSNFPVGAALLCNDGTVFIGCNVENASYPAAICAERNAVSTAVASGHKKFSVIALIANTDDYCSPCGICRQVLVEFSSDMDVIMANKDKKYIVKKASDLLPGFFALKYKNESELIK